MKKSQEVLQNLLKTLKEKHDVTAELKIENGESVIYWSSKKEDGLYSLEITQLMDALDAGELKEDTFVWMVRDSVLEKYQKGENMKNTDRLSKKDKIVETISGFQDSFTFLDLCSKLEKENIQDKNLAIEVLGELYENGLVDHYEISKDVWVYCNTKQ